ncbi:MAG: C40 family peptidase [Synergistaceae bacterium]|nr:C40 family peptidase [Synergistaceae bacterium]
MRKITVLLMLMLCACGCAFAEEFMAVVTVPSAPLLAGNKTLDDEVLYGMTMNAVPSGDIVLLQMPYGVDPVAYENVRLISREKAEEWRASITHTVIAPFADVQAEPRTSSFPPLITLPRGALLGIGQVNSDDERYAEAILFGGVRGWIRRPLVREVRVWNTDGEEQTRRQLVNDAMLYLGTSYRWGGQTPEGVDCSGMTHMAYILNGLEIFRNSRPKTGFPIALKHVPGTSDDTHTLETLASVKPGDLIHWSGHVGMYLGEGKFIHANGRDFSTTIASLISGDEGYREDIARPSTINTFGTAFPDEPDKLTVREFYALPCELGNITGYRFYVRADGYAPNRAVLYPEGKDGPAIVISEDIDVWRFVYSGRDSDKAPAYFYSKPGEYTPAVELINDEGYRPSGKTITSGIVGMSEPLKVE